MKRRSELRRICICLTIEPCRTASSLLRDQLFQCAPVMTRGNINYARLSPLSPLPKVVNGCKHAAQQLCRMLILHSTSVLGRSFLFLSYTFVDRVRCTTKLSTLTNKKPIREAIDILRPTSIAVILGSAFLRSHPQLPRYINPFLKHLNKLANTLILLLKLCR
jgi:hypothetical protein